MIDSLHHYLIDWNLADPALLVQTPTSYIYTVQSSGETAILKLIKPNGIEERAGAEALRCFDGHGAVRLLRSDEDAHLLEYADGNDLTGLVKRGGDDDATVIIADVLSQLHGAYHGSQPEGLTPLRRWFDALFRRASGVADDDIYSRGAKVAGKLLDHPRQQTVLHGDIHHENIRHKPGRGWLAFDPKGLYGERTYDLANTFCNPLNMNALVENEGRVLRTAEIFSQKLDIDRGRILAYVFAYTCLSASWSMEDGSEEDAASTLRIAAIVEPHVSIVG
jgi:streptomycin 6-kinase